MLQKKSKPKTILAMLREFPAEFDLFPVKVQYYHTGTCRCCGRSMVYLDELRSSSMFFLEDYKLDVNEYDDDPLPHLVYPELFQKSADDVKCFYFDLKRETFFISYVEDGYENETDTYCVCSRCSFGYSIK